MRIIGNGFIARHLEPLSGRHHGVTVLAAGAPRQQLPDAEHEREADLVRRAARHCRRTGQLLVFFSTASMYGAPGCRGREDEPVRAATRYGQHKLDLERMVIGSGADHLVLRLAYVLGPHGPEFRLVPALIRQIRSGRIQIYRDARRDMLYVSDFVRILDWLLAAGVGNEVVNVASGDCVPILRVIEHLEDRLGVTAERVVVGDSVAHCPSVAKLRALLPQTRGSRFGPGYYRSALDRYLAAVEAGPATSRRPPAR
jgi:nucleoside-diphosphate-sugar epimerase